MFGMWDLADHYNQHIGVAITSLAMNCSLPVTVHLLHDENLHKDLRTQGKIRSGGVKILP